MIVGQKHLVRCRCVLPQFKRLTHPIQHQFVVFSVIDNDVVKPKFAQCNNCGVIHKVYELGKSEILSNKESMSSIITIDDVKSSIPQQLIDILEKNNVDLPTWENAKFVYENKLWDQFIVLRTDTDDDVKQGKYLRIIGENLFKVDSFVREDGLK